MSTRLNQLTVATSLAQTDTFPFTSGYATTPITKQISLTNITTNLTGISLTTQVIGTLPIANGGTAGTTASAARTALGLAIGTNVEAWSASLDTLSAKSLTGTGDIVLATTPTLITPILGVATATSINKVAITAPATSATLTIANGKTLTASDTTTIGTNSLTLAGGEVITFTATNALTLTTTGSTSVTLPTSGTLSTTAGTETFTNKRITKRVGTVANSATPTPDADTNDIYTVTALAQAATFGAPTGTPTNGQSLIIRVLDNGTARALAFNAIYRFSSDLSAPTTTVLSKTLYIGFIYNSAVPKWDCVALLGNF